MIIKFLLIGLSFVVAFFAGVAILMLMAIATHQYVVPFWYGYIAGAIVTIPAIIYSFFVANAG